MDGSWWIEIIFLAMLAGFIALRLVSVLGRRTGEERPVTDAYVRGGAEVAQPGAQVIELQTRQQVDLPEDVDADVKTGLAAIAQADAQFDPARFAEGAKAAYRMILEAYWKGDMAEVEPFLSNEVAEDFKAAMDARREEGASVENRLLSVDRAQIVAASLDGMMAEVSVRFDAQIAQGAAGAVPTHDEWTFRRHVAAGDPNWLLVATDADEA